MLAWKSLLVDEQIWGATYGQSCMIVGSSRFWIRLACRAVLWLTVGRIGGESLEGSSR